jgi:hypothetical protein
MQPTAYTAWLIRDVNLCEKGFFQANTLEAKKIKIKTLIICLGAICFVEAARWLVSSRHLWDPMIGLGTARLVETILILLVVLLWGKGRHKGANLVSRFRRGRPFGFFYPVHLWP